MLGLILVARPLELVSAGRGGGERRRIDGYHDKRGRWIPGIPDARSWLRGAPTYSYGVAVFYGPGVMEATARYRGRSLEGYLDGIALMSPIDIGSTAWLRRPGGSWEGPFLVVDCARQVDIYRIVAFAGEVVEVGFKTAVRWKMAKQVPGAPWFKMLRPRIPNVEVALTIERPPEDPAIEPVDYSAWWLDRVAFMPGPGREPRARQVGRIWILPDGTRLIKSQAETWPDLFAPRRLGRGFIP